jgi:lipopolysaccharide transport system ATP-binding protein
MSKPIIQVEDISKKYLLGHQVSPERYQSLRDALSKSVRSAVMSARGMVSGRQMIHGDEVEEFWALKDVSFEVKEGEVLGVIGRNGAGKSTLLKLLSRITEPTQGKVTLRGRVASLLEVGTGFHPELSGRENIYLNGAILGMSRAEIRTKFDEIVDFAEVEKFLDTPVKRYSSGMYVRLAFAVAAHLEPEVLIIDEVLAVGDLVFQKKCIGKMKNVAKSGRTVIFVSHNMQTVRGLTDRAILLAGGRLIENGASHDVVEKFLSNQAPGETVYTAPTVVNPEQPYISRVEIFTSNSCNVHQFGKPLKISMQLMTPEKIPNAAISFHIMTSSHQPVIHVLNLDSEIPMLRSPGVHEIVCTLPTLRLYPGHYHLRFYFGASQPRRVFEGLEQVCAFEVVQLEEVREFYWYPDNAIYVEESEWTCTTRKN